MIVICRLGLPPHFFFFFLETAINSLSGLFSPPSATDTIERHPITNAIDGKNTWWQSPSIKNGVEYHYVTITLDLQQVEYLFSFSTFEIIPCICYLFS